MSKKKQANRTAPKSSRRMLLATGGLVGAAIVLGGVFAAGAPKAPIASTVNPAPAPALKERPTLDNLSTLVSGVKASTAPKEAGEYFVFFDPQCMHCSTLWQILLPYKDKISVTWIPVAFLNQNSVLQGADILSDSDPVKRLTLHEGLMHQRRGGLTVTGSPREDAQAKLQANGQVLAALNVKSVPHVWGKSADGKVVTMTGAGTPETVREKLGLPKLD